MKKIKIIALAIMLAFLVTIPGFTTVKADETLVTPNKLVVFKISDYNYYTQDIGSDVVNKVKMDAAPLIKENRTFVPVRFLGNALGVTDSNIQWDKATRTATLKGKAELVLKDGEKAVTTNGNKQAIDVAPYVIPPGRTMLPTRYAAEGLGFTVEWDKANQLAICYPAGSEKPDMSKVLQEIKKTEPVVPKPGELPKGVENMPVWGPLPTIPVENGVRVSPPEYKTHDYSISVDIREPGALDNGCAILADILKDPAAGEKAKNIILKAKKDDIWADFSGRFESGNHTVSAAGGKSPHLTISIWPLGSSR